MSKLLLIFMIISVQPKYEAPPLSFKERERKDCAELRSVRKNDFMIPYI
jgi:hypothetical protein